MKRRIDRLKCYKRKGIDVFIISLLINIFLCVTCTILILSEALIYKNIRLYLATALMVCIILENIVLYKFKGSVKDETEYLNSATAKNRIHNSKFEMYKSKDNLTGLYNDKFLKNLLKKINMEKFTPTTIGVFHIQGFAFISDEEIRKKIICNMAEVVLKNKFKNNIACISENNNIVLFFINYNNEDSNYICKKICNDFNEINKFNNIKLIYGIDCMYSDKESIYKVLGEAMNFINS